MIILKFELLKSLFDKLNYYYELKVVINIQECVWCEVKSEGIAIDSVIIPLACSIGVEWCTGCSVQALVSCIDVLCKSEVLNLCNAKW